MARFRRHIPNSVTLFNISLGFASILLTHSGEYEKAAGLILASALIDSFDGYLARKLNSTSKIGGYLDTVSDFISFGVATAYVMMRVFDVHLLLAFLYVFCAGYRLCYFMRHKTSTFFYGIPTTAAGGFLATVVILRSQSPFNDILMFAISLLMISRRKYNKVVIKNRRNLTLLLSVYISLFVLDYRLCIEALWYTFFFYIVFGWMKIRDE